MDVGVFAPALLGFKNGGMAADCAQTMAAKRPWFTLAAEKCFFAVGAGGNMHWIWFLCLRALDVRDAFGCLRAAEGARCVVLWRMMGGISENCKIGLAFFLDFCYHTKRCFFSNNTPAGETLSVES